MSQKINGIIYKATNILNNKIYIGMTTQSLKDRMYGHFWSSVNSDKNYHFLNAIRKYGWENFSWDIVEEGLYESIEELREKEVYWISLFDSFISGYNSTIGGEGVIGFDHSGENNSRALLKEEEVLQILDLLNTNEKTIREIAEMFNVGNHVVSRINSGRSWSHLYEESPLQQGRQMLHADVSGQRNAKAQLTDKQVYEIKHKLTNGSTRREIMDEYDISYQLIQRIIRGVHWSHVEYEGFQVKVEVDSKESREEEVRVIKNMMADGMTSHEIQAFFGDRYSNIFLSEIRTNKIWKQVVIDRPIGDTYLSLTEEDVKEIKKLLYQGVRQNVIAEQFGVVRSTITQINRGKIWSHVIIDTSSLIKDELLKPRQVKGRKLTDDDIREIKRLLKQGLSHGVIAEQFGVSRTGISKINTGQRFARITLDEDVKLDV